MMMLIIIVGYTTHPALAGSGSAYLFYNTNKLSAGRINDISNILSGRGYSTSVAANPSKSTVKNRIMSGYIFYFSTHGSPGSISCSDGSLTAKELAYSPLRMAYLSACQAANSSSTNGSFMTKFEQLGVLQIVAFSQNVSASTSTNGIHYFNYGVFAYLSQGYTLASAATTAKAAVYNAYGSYYGCDSVVYRGGAYTLP